MGLCTSCEATTVAPITTAKLILINGELREFACPVKAAQALQKDEEFFVCDADEMDFGGFVTAVPDTVELRLGQIYFVLPRSMLRQPLQAADLAALAVKASSALMRAAPDGETKLVFSETRSEPAERTPERRRRKRSSGSGRSFESNLSSIVE
ncbi:uncharacterized protein LOC110113818 [Dendrobium catenatum]|uniref:DUF4228 domain-containing protein n=1 Tax=Dendrobium catenatum TaxID=906689 RepID=A0A2I0WWA1_9ASPA|nr:uncharacterized protein LOC110113818 [Dendrobium catenatum]PKU79942.1 hypothetical protein MA16_Dca025097 [Dendrobium catenatum]